LSIASRLVVRLAIVAASLAWAGFVLTHTVADPGRGERIAEAVLADDAARAQVVAPMSSAVMSTTGLPPEQRSFVDANVDRVLRDPSTAAAFVDPFAGSWARLWGEDDPRPSDVDLAPVVDAIAASTPGLGTGLLPTNQFIAPAVPLPRAQLGWMAGVRSFVGQATLVLAVAAAVGFALGFALGNRRWVLRRAGVWAIVAGIGWVVVPIVLVWAARRWAPGADQVVAVATEEAVGGLRATALLLVGAGVAVFASSFAPVGFLRVPDLAGGDTATRPVPVAPAPSPGPRRASRATPVTARRRTVASTATLPVVEAPTTPVDMVEVETVPVETAPSRAEVARAYDPEGESGDSLWDFYS
jgi:hypothetical protein